MKKMNGIELQCSVFKSFNGLWNGSSLHSDLFGKELTHLIAWEDRSNKLVNVHKCLNVVKSEFYMEKREVDPAKLYLFQRHPLLIYSVAIALFTIAIKPIYIQYIFHSWFINDETWWTLHYYLNISYHNISYHINTAVTKHQKHNGHFQIVSGAACAKEVSEHRGV